MCPQCGSRMILRKGPYGEFYGCSRFPLCEHTIKKIDGEDLKEFQERKFEEISRKNSRIKEIIETIETLDDEKEAGLLNKEGEKKLKELEGRLKERLKLIEESENERQLELLAGEEEGKTPKFSLDDVPKLSWLNLLFLHNRERTEFIKWKLQSIRKIEITFNQKIKTQFFYDEIISLLEDIKGEIERGLEIAKPPRKIRQFLEKELAEGNIIFAQVKNNCEINGARYKLGKKYYENGLEKLGMGQRWKTNKKWEKATSFFKKISPHYREYCESYLMPWLFTDNPRDDLYYNETVCENVQKEIKKVLEEIQKIKKEVGLDEVNDNYKEVEDGEVDSKDIPS